MDDDEDRSGGKERTTGGEYALGALGGLLVVLLLGFLTYQAVAVRESGAELSVTVTSVEPSGDGYAVHFRVVNTGGRTAEQVQVSGTLSQNGSEVEQSTATVAYVPPESWRVGALLFSEDPGTGRLQVGPSGYTAP
ncbi:hypothetical protein [Blastococcus capsensis]|uniref:hypothetical protein n=1 Tax=Blastococcus capsensis TaxID=1564163 RepID=UPI0025415328|nr:hypothetical protein [Blastococcus capsensis]MDK3255780.1 hypothetical protein [Blastococcus capsensis]